MQAVDQLWECESLFPKANEAIVADYLEILAVVRGHRPPSFFDSNGSAAWNERLAFFMNELPWERRRAVGSMARMTESRLDYADAVANWLTPVAANRHFGDLSQRMKATLDFASGDSIWGAGLSNPVAFADYAWDWLKRKQDLIEAAQTSFLPAIELGLRSMMPIRMQEFLRRTHSAEAR